MMTNIAIVTGASSGLGQTFVETIATTEKAIDEIWVIARREQLLMSIADKYVKKRIKIVPLDLTDLNSFVKIKQLFQVEKPNVKILVNNAGMVSTNPFANINLDKQQKMIDLNAKAPISLIYEALPYMKRGSQIINVCSVAGFAPTPNMLIYSSTKAFLYNFTKGLHVELKSRGIQVLALCPGNMKTELFNSPEMPQEKSVVDKLPFLDMKKVTVESLIKAKAGAMVYTPHVVYKGYHLLAKMLPHKLLMHFSKI
jgi:short-subunit dehydrogenase